MYSKYSVLITLRHSPSWDGLHSPADAKPGSPEKKEGEQTWLQRCPRELATYVAIKLVSQAVGAGLETKQVD